jgi:hypothetical protein
VPLERVVVYRGCISIIPLDFSCHICYKYSLCIQINVS